MTQALLTPLKADWPHLSAGPSPAEQYVADWFEERLPNGWEIYVRPYLNGTTPSLVLLHPRHGIAVYEVVDCNPDDYTVRSFIQDKHVLEANGQPLEGLENPYLLARNHKGKIHRWCTQVIGSSAFGLITAGVIFTGGSTRHWNELLFPFRDSSESKSMNPVVGADALQSGKVSWVLPRAFHNTARVAMTEQAADLLRLWLTPPDFSQQVGDSLVLDDVQATLVHTDPGSSGYRRVKGPAGCGKSVVLAYRAALLAMRGHKVLVTCFNITLTNYLRMLLGQALKKYAVNSSSAYDAWSRVEIHHYHEWAYDNCKCHPHEEDCLQVGVCGCPPDSKFDAVMVDEGQDFEPEWWQHIRLCALKDGAEVMFAADVTQDLYGKSKSWTDATMRNAGFRGRWSTLPYSYRVPSGMVPMLQDYVANFMQGKAAELPEVVQGDLNPIAMRWVQMPADSHWGDVCLRELQRVVSALPDGQALTDVAFLFWTHGFGFEFVTAMSVGFYKVAHIFVEPGVHVDGATGQARDTQDRSRPLKLAFPNPTSGLRAITSHSYKGWEARHLVVHVPDLYDGVEEMNRATLFYVALTRLVRDPLGSSLTVVSSCPELADFGRRHFADYEEIDRQ